MEVLHILTSAHITYIKEIYRSKGKPQIAFRIFCIGLTIFFLAVNLGGCTWYRPLRLPQLRDFEKRVQEEYPRTSVSCGYAYGAGVSITVKGPDFDEECAYTILGYFQPVASDEEFIQDLFELFEKESHSEPNWKNGRRPEIWLFLTADGKDRYQFTAMANKEVYNSGRSPDSYTWDGYTTWYGTEIVNDSVREITSDEIKEEIKKYT